MKNIWRPTFIDTAEHPHRLALLIGFHIVVCCVSLIFIAGLKLSFPSTTFHIFFDPARWYVAVFVAAAFALVSLFFVFAEFSFGYFVGFYLYTMVLAYLWLNCFSDLSYDHRSAGLSAAASSVAFLVPALFLTSPIRQIDIFTPRSFDRLLMCLLILGVATLTIGAIYNFRITSLEQMNEYRAKVSVPVLVKYSVTIVSSTLLPFAFAGFVARKAYWRATSALVLLLLFYPIVLNKTVLATPLWLVGILLVSKLAEARIAVVLSLLGPVLVGLVLILLFSVHGNYFNGVYFRIIAVPGVALDVYNDFFSKHDLTYFCQISFVKQMMKCPYQNPLAVVMEGAYDLGSFNASLFATEGIASVGVLFAPAATFLCGLVIALGNRLSAGLPSSFILISAAVMPPTLLNVPLSIVLLTHGAGFLFLLWYVTPRTIFLQGSAVQRAVAD